MKVLSREACGVEIFVQIYYRRIMSGYPLDGKSKFRHNIYYMTLIIPRGSLGTRPAVGPGI
jgi:hypothetical protein